MTSEWRERYTLYINSAEWQRKRHDALVQAAFTCQRCGCFGDDHRGKGLEVHHLNYDNLGEELPEDLKVVCRDCHELEDRERARRGTQARAEARHDAGVETYARKKYGDHWDEYISWEEVSEEFDEWLESKG